MDLGLTDRVYILTGAANGLGFATAEVLVAEGAPNRARQLIAAEKKKAARIAGTTPVYDLIVGDGEGQVGLRELEKHFLKLPRNIKGKQVNELDRKLKAMGTGAMPIPKGPMPTRMPRR